MFNLKSIRRGDIACKLLKFRRIKRQPIIKASLIINKTIWSSKKQNPQITQASDLLKVVESPTSSRWLYKLRWSEKLLVLIQATIDLCHKFWVSFFFSLFSLFLSLSVSIFFSCFMFGVHEFSIQVKAEMRYWRKSLALD